ncbi:MAG: hypothetical protein V4620_14145 [Bacteroidota bacterium]
MKTVKFILGAGFITLLLLVSVILVDSFFLLLKHQTNTASATAFSSFSCQQMLLGFISDSLRAVLLCYLFPQLKQAGTSMAAAIKFGLTISALMSTLWLLFGYFDLKLTDPDFFLLYDGLIFTIQGMLSGLGLHMLSKRKFI